MNLPLQPMDKAPRDGREVWIMRDPNTIVKCHWLRIDTNDECWCENGVPTWDDDDLLGWLDIEALVRDSERLDWLLPVLSLAEGPTDERTIRIAGALMLNMSGRAAIDAAIDKEAGRGT